MSKKTALTYPQFKQGYIILFVPTGNVFDRFDQDSKSNVYCSLESISLDNVYFLRGAAEAIKEVYALNHNYQVVNVYEQFHKHFQLRAQRIWKDRQGDLIEQRFGLHQTAKRIFIHSHSAPVSPEFALQQAKLITAELNGDMTKYKKELEQFSAVQTDQIRAELVHSIYLNMLASYEKR